MVSANEAGFNLREMSPLPRNILHSLGVTTQAETGRRPHPLIRAISMDDRGWLLCIISPKDVRGQLDLPSDRSGYREERDGLLANRHLNDLAESITMNVGGPCGKGCSPPMKRMGVGGIIVLGGRENRPHGEGCQLVGISKQISRMKTGMKFP
jgi:hypothetical protein